VNPSCRDALIVAIGGGSGAVLRWLAASSAKNFNLSPVAAIFAVNISGCFLFGFLHGFTQARGHSPASSAATPPSPPSAGIPISSSAQANPPPLSPTPQAAPSQASQPSGSASSPQLARSEHPPFHHFHANPHGVPGFIMVNPSGNP